MPLTIEIKGVTIGDKFIKPGNGNRICTVVDFVERKSLMTGTINYEVWATNEVMGQPVNFETSFTTVKRYRTF